MKNKSGSNIAFKKVICFILSLIMACSGFFALLLGNIQLRDYAFIINAFADEATPGFYCESNLVGLYNPDYTDTETMYYKIGENGNWTSYVVPFAIPAYQATTVYARIGENGTIVYQSFTNDKNSVGYYSECQTDFSITYNDLTYDYTRYYDSRTNEWYYSYESRLFVEDAALICAKMPDASELYFVRSGNTYIDSLTGDSLIYDNINNRYALTADSIIYYYTATGYLIEMADYYGNYLTFTSTLADTTVKTPEEDSYIIGNGSSMYIISDFSDEADDEPFYAYYATTDPNNNDLGYYFVSHNNTINYHQYLDEVKDQEGITVAKYFYTEELLTKSNDQTITYNADGRMTRVQKDDGSWISYAYDDNNMSYSTLDSLGNTTTTVYNDAFLPVSVTDESGYTTTYTYDGHYNILTQSTDGETVSYTYDTNNNLLTQSSTDSDSENVIYTYDNNGNLIKEQTGNDYVYYAYNSYGDITVSATLKEDYTGTPPAIYNPALTCFDRVLYTYDSEGRTTQITDEVNNEVTQYTYDDSGNNTQISTTVTENGVTTTTVTTYTYDVFGNVLTTQAGNDTGSYIYDKAGRLLRATENGVVTRTVYDSEGRVVQEISAEDYSTTDDGLPNDYSYANANVGQRYHYNAVGQVDYEINRLNVRTDYTYHTNGVTASEAFDIYEYSYNNKGNVTEIAIDGANTPYATYNYNTAGTVLQSIDYGNGQSVIYEYNSDGKVISQSYKESPNATAITQFVYEYDSTSKELTAKIDLNAQRYTAYGNNIVTVSELVTTVTNNDTAYSAGTLIYSYAETEEIRTNNTVTTPATATKAYNGNTLGITYNENSTDYTLNNSSLFNVSESYNETNHTSVAAFKDSNDNTLFSNAYTFDTDGNISAMTSGNVSTSYVYYNEGRITEYHQGNEAAYYTYDSKGQVIREDLNYTGYQKTFTYTYDNRGNLTRKREYAYTRDSLENLTATTNLDFDYDDEVWLDEIDNAGEYELIYDENGNPVDISGLVLSWTNGRQLAGTSYIYENTEYPVSSYTYDDEGIRTARTEWNTTTYYTTEDGVITSQYELDSQGNKQNEMIFIYDGGEPVALLYGGYTYYYEKNAMGDVVAILDEDGDTVVSYRYDAWGNNVKWIFGTCSCDEDRYVCCQNPIRYRGYYYDDDGFGAYYLQSRYYECEFNRFLNADIPNIAQQSKYEINGLNLFVYCCNDPLNYVDFEGYDATSINPTDYSSIINELINSSAAL